MTNTLLRYKIIGTTNKFKKWPRPLFRPKTNHPCNQKPNPPRETVPLNYQGREVPPDLEGFGETDEAHGLLDGLGLRGGGSSRVRLRLLSRRLTRLKEKKIAKLVHSLRTVLEAYIMYFIWRC
jgi:hypothetical protein